MDLFHAGAGRATGAGVAGVLQPAGNQFARDDVLAAGQELFDHHHGIGAAILRLQGSRPTRHAGFFRLH